MKNTNRFTWMNDRTFNIETHTDPELNAAFTKALQDKGSSFKDKEEKCASEQSSCCSSDICCTGFSEMIDGLTSKLSDKYIEQLIDTVRLGILSQVDQASASECLAKLRDELKRSREVEVESARTVSLYLAAYWQEKDSVESAEIALRDAEGRIRQLQTDLNIRDGVYEDLNEAEARIKELELKNYDTVTAVPEMLAEWRVAFDNVCLERDRLIKENEGLKKIEEAHIQHETWFGKVLTDTEKQRDNLRTTVAIVTKQRNENHTSFHNLADILDKKNLQIDAMTNVVNALGYLLDFQGHQDEQRYHDAARRALTEYENEIDDVSED